MGPVRRDLPNPRGCNVPAKRAPEALGHSNLARLVLASRGIPMVRMNPESSVIGAATRVTGRISGEGALSIEGQVKGDVSITGPAEIADGGAVEGNVKAESLEVLGSLLGDAHASGAIAVRSGALVRGELRAAEVSIEPGSRVSVRLDTNFELDLGAPRRR
jgi:cytoskeletal protein CcmA (bactofilin family)